MSKQPLSSLSSIMPVKGEAARVEEMPIARPKRVVRGSPPFEPVAAPVRDGLTIRILRSDNERLRAIVFKENRSKQSLLDQAISEFLDNHGS